MTAKNKARGNTFERLLVKKAIEKGLISKRAYASDGRSLGCSEKVDVLVGSFRIQAKKRKKLPAYLALEKDVDAVIFGTDRQEPLVLIPYKVFLDLIGTSNEDN